MLYRKNIINIVIFFSSTWSSYPSVHIKIFLETSGPIETNFGTMVIVRKLIIISGDRVYQPRWPLTKNNKHVNKNIIHGICFLSWNQTLVKQSFNGRRLPELYPTCMLTESSRWQNYGKFT